MTLPAATVLLDSVISESPTGGTDRKSTRLNSSHSQISYAVFCLKKKNNNLSEHSQVYELMGKIIPQVLTAGRYFHIDHINPMTRQSSDDVDLTLPATQHLT